MTSFFVWLKPLAHALTCWRPHALWLAWGLVLAGCLPGQVQATTCSTSSMTMRSGTPVMTQTDPAMPTTIYYPPTPNVTFFKGYMEWTTRCSRGLITLNAYFLPGSINGNSGILVTPQTASYYAGCEASTGIVAGINSFTMGNFTLSLWSCVIRFPFTLTTSGTFSASDIKEFSIGPNAAFSASSPKAVWGDSPDITNTVSNALTYTFKPMGCNVTTKTPNVALNTVSTTALSNQTATQNWTKFSILLDTCTIPSGKSSFSISSAFDYTSASATDLTLIQNTTTGATAASAVGVQLATAANESNVVTSTTNAPATTYAMGSVSSGTSSTRFDLYARLKKASSGTLKAGNVSATATFTLTYQ